MQYSSVARWRDWLIYWPSLPVDTHSIFIDRLRLLHRILYHNSMCSKLKSKYQLASIDKLNSESINFPFKTIRVTCSLLDHHDLPQRAVFHDAECMEFHEQRLRWCEIALSAMFLQVLPNEVIDDTCRLIDQNVRPRQTRSGWWLDIWKLEIWLTPT